MIHRPGGASLLIPGLTVVQPRPSGAAGYVGPFDGITFAALYGLKRFLTAYTGSLIRLRRDSDNAESDFGYDEATGLLDTAAIATWLGAANGAFPTFRDQSGNTVNLTQSTAGAQPLYAASGVNSLPALNLSPSSYVHWMSNTTSASVSGNDLTMILGVALAGVPFNGRAILDLRKVGNANPIHAMTGNTTPSVFGRTRNDAGALKDTTAKNAGAFDIFTYRRDAMAQVLEFYQNGGTPVTATSVTGDVTTDAVYLGSENAATINLRGQVVFLAILESAIAAAAHNTIGNELATTYGISWTNVS